MNFRADLTALKVLKGKKKNTRKHVSANVFFTSENRNEGTTEEISCSVVMKEKTHLVNSQIIFFTKNRWGDRLNFLSVW